MGIGVSIVLIAVGAILAFALEVDVAGVDIAVVGYILMAVGIVGLIMTLLVFGPRRTAARSGGVVEERRTYDDRL